MKFLPALALLALSSPAVAGACGDRAQLLDTLASQYDEEPVAMGLDDRGAVLEVLTSPSGTWTLLLTYPSGRTCLMASGVAFERLPVQVGEAGA